jgi:hypothetical protein
MKTYELHKIHITQVHVLPVAASLCGTVAADCLNPDITASDVPEEGPIMNVKHSTAITMNNYIRLIHLFLISQM